MLSRKGLRPLHYLRGVIVGDCFTHYLFAASTALVWYASMQGVHGGCDFTLKFPWVYGDAAWVSGHTWERLKAH